MGERLGANRWEIMADAELKKQLEKKYPGLQAKLEAIQSDNILRNYLVGHFDLTRAKQSLLQLEEFLAANPHLLRHLRQSGQTLQEGMDMQMVIVPEGRNVESPVILAKQGPLELAMIPILSCTRNALTDTADIMMKEPGNKQSAYSFQTAGVVYREGWEMDAEKFESTFGQGYTASKNYVTYDLKKMMPPGYLVYALGFVNEVFRLNLQTTNVAKMG